VLALGESVGAPATGNSYVRADLPILAQEPDLTPQPGIVLSVKRSSP
jgi:hypothetical protein